MMHWLLVLRIVLQEMLFLELAMESFTKTGQKKIGTASGFWDASADSYLTAGNSSIGATGTGDWTIEMWLYNDISQAAILIAVC